MVEKNRSILDHLKLREELDRKILKSYEDILYKLFQVIYEVDAEVKWERIFRFSEESNFICISGKAILPMGTELSGNRTLTSEVTLSPSITIPWIMLDDGSTAYEIAEAAKDISAFGNFVGPHNFVDMMRSGDFDYESIKSTVDPINEIEVTKPTEDGPVVDINMADITEGQMRRMMLEDDDGEKS